MENCLITKLKGAVDNEHLLEMNELKIETTQFVNDVYRMVIRFATIGSRDFRTDSANTLLSTDRTNWGKTAVITQASLNDNATFLYVKVDNSLGVIGDNNNMAVGTIILKDKYNFAFMKGENQETGKSDGAALIPDSSLKYTPQKLEFKYALTDINMADFLGVQCYNRTTGAPTDYYLKKFSKMYYDRTKFTEVEYIPEINTAYFPLVNQCVDWLEDLAANYGPYGRRIRIMASLTDGALKIGLNDAFFTAYKTRVYNSLVALLTAATPPIELLFYGIIYTYSNGQLLGDGEPVVIA